MNRIPRADWAAQAPWNGIAGKPDWAKGATFPLVDLANVTWKGTPSGKIPYWNGTRFVPIAVPSGGGGGGGSGTTIGDGDSPATAVRRRPIGNPSGEFENVWARYEANVKQFGATGNGGQIDSDAVTAASQALQAAGGGTLYFPSGTYRLPNLSPINTPCLIRGDGIGATILDFDSTAGLGFYLPSGTSLAWFGVRDLTLQDSPIPVTVLNGRIFAQNVSIQCGTTGFLIGDAASVPWGTSEKLRGGMIQGCQFFGLGTSVGVHGSADDLEICDCNFLSEAAVRATPGGWDKAIWITAGTAVAIHDLSIDTTETEAIRLDALVSGCRVDNLRFRMVAGTSVVNDFGSNNYVNELFGLGGSAVTLFDARKELFQKFSWAPGTVSPGYGYYDDFSFPGVALGDQVEIGVPLDLGIGVTAVAEAKAANTVRLTVINLGTSVANLTSALWPVRVFN